MGIKNKLKEIRMREYLMNQGEFSKMLEIPLTTYSQWERGKSNPTLETSLMIAKKLNKKIEEIWLYEE